MSKPKLILTIVALIIIIWYFKKMKTPKFNRDGTRADWNVEQVKAAFKKVAQDYGVEYARKLEQLFRLEVGHWEKGASGQWQRCLSPGMVASKKKQDAFPYGWTSLERFVGKYPKYQNGWYTVYFEKTSDGPLYYVGFPSVEASVEYVAWFIKEVRAGRFGHWRADSNEQLARSYEEKMTTVKPRFN